MDDIISKINTIDWEKINTEMNDKGYVVVPKFLSDNQCRNLIDQYNNPVGYRKTVTMERYRFGLGEYKYFDYPLPNIVQTIRESLYPKLVPIANSWMMLLKIDKQFPNTLLEMQAECQSNKQLKPTALLLKYGRGGFNTLHQDLYGEVYFPLQAALFLNDPNVDFKGVDFH